MIRAFVFSLLVSLVTFSVVVAPSQVFAANPKHVTIGFIPGENPETLRENGVEFGKMLESKIGVPVKIFISKDYTSLIDAMKEKKIDFAFFTAMSFVFAEKQAGAKVLLKKIWDGPFYWSTILVRTDSKISKLSQLKGKKFAFVDKKSSSGFLYPQVQFKKEGIDPTTFFGEVVYSGNHDASIHLLEEKKVDAVAVFSNDAKAVDSAWHRFAPKTTKVKVKPLWISAPIPNDPFCVRQDFYEANPRLSHDLMFALKELDDDTKQGSHFKKLLGVSALIMATSQQYEPVRDLVKELDLKLE
ncbi:MAG: phosphate/phosphite/phosphonate ABC transporter substrate-binding protein [Bdellovibrionota bacterium]